MKNVLLFGFGKMGSSIARGWMFKKLDFNIFYQNFPTLSNSKIFFFKKGRNTWDEYMRIHTQIQI